MARKIAKAETGALKVSVGNLERYYNAEKAGTKTITVNVGTTGETFDVVVTPTLSFADAVDFVNSVKDTMFQSDGGYRAVLREFAIRHVTMVRFTNVRLPKDVTKEYEILFGTDLYKMVVDAIDADFYGMLIDAVDDQVGYEIEMTMSDARKEVADAVKVLTDVTNAYATFMDTVQKLAGPEVFELANKLKSSARDVQEVAAMVREQPDAVTE